MSWFSRLRNALNPHRLDKDLAEEIKDHLERKAAALGQNGLDPDEAEGQARVRFGNTTRLREESRDIRLWAGLEGTLQDIRYAWRGMRKTPAFATTVIVSLALAIGANTAIYSLVDAAILRPLPVHDPGGLFRLWYPDITDPGIPAGSVRDSFSYPEYLQFGAAAKPAAHLALFSSPNRVEARALQRDATIERINRAYVSGEAFDLLGVRPAVGRLFSAEEDRLPQGRALAVLSYDYWQRRFGRDPAILGRNIFVNKKAFEIAGVARQGFWGVEPGKLVDIWLPGTQYEAQALTEPGWHWFHILGRYAPGISPEQVQARLQPSFHDFALQMVRRFPSMPPAIRKQFLDGAIRLGSAATGVSDFRKTFSRPLWIVFGVAAGILLIACANVASLLLARSTARATEMAMRISLGASRGRLVRQMLTESLLFSLLAGALGWMLARLAGPLLVHMLSKEGDPLQFVLAVDTRVLLFSIGVATASAVIFGLVPALQASGAQPVHCLRASTGQAGKLRLGKLFVSAQVACAFCLVAVGAAFLFSLGNLLRVDPGFDAQNVSVLNVTVDSPEEADWVSSRPNNARIREWMAQLQERVGSQPGVQAAALAWWPIFGGTSWTEQIIVPSGPSDREEILYRVSPGYFAALGTRLLAGRDLEPRDHAVSAPAPVVVNEAFARKYFGVVNAVGREFSYPDNSNKSQVHQVIVGIAADAHYGSLRKEAEPMVYLPVQGSNSFTIYVRSTLRTGQVLQMVERETKSFGSKMQIHEITTLETLVGNTLLREKLLAGVGGAFAFFGMLLAGIGLFGLLSYSVGRRVKEIGIRAALGARRSQIVALVLRDIAGLIGGGTVVGLAGALAILVLLRSLLFGIRMADPLVTGTAIGLFFVTGLAAASLPAHRAATVDPVRALREE